MIRSECWTLRYRALLLLWSVVAFVMGLGVLDAGPAAALTAIDFEQPYYVHPGWQVWDFCLIQNIGMFHLFYHAMPMDDPFPDASDHIWRTSTHDLIHWTPPVQVLAVSSAEYETRAVWAPDVVFDEGTGFWWMTYTGVDDLRNQRLCVARSTNLVTWTKSYFNPIQEPEPPVFFYFPEGGWSECRDPFLFRRDDMWQVLSTVKTWDHPDGHAAIAVASSDNLQIWNDPEVLFLSGSSNPQASLESSQYQVYDGTHHLFFHEYATGGISHIAAADFGGWDYEERATIDLGIAPEIDSFDGGVNWVFARIAPYQEPNEDAICYVVRCDSLDFFSGLQAPLVRRAVPLSRHFEAFSGNIVLGNPCFGDNPARRGEDPVGLVGNYYFGSREYFQGPLSGRGIPGQELGDSATGYLNSYPFVVAGNSISLLVGGTENIEECYVALMDAAADTVLRWETGEGIETMTERGWNVIPYQGREVYIRIEDSDPHGHINVDDIRESMVLVGIQDAGPVAAAAIVDRGPRPNPFNPQTTLHFEASAPTTARVAVYDLRGRLVWQTGTIPVAIGANAVSWDGRDRSGDRLPGGVYVYRIDTGGHVAASGKFTLVP